MNTKINSFIFTFHTSVLLIILINIDSF